ncbi:(2Fe-2S) ferredoxin domain-containing protein [Nocardioides sp.]|uniref:(2Fe-2S) ferredoxin domain-containing protein n=1 Tax=Nocardioides sp. TaxID=35761 RepID=UPI0027363118|nr:(2Fe-2S) ferredoxin domain-containing protein [Nocardioides sp.]
MTVCRGCCCGTVEKHPEVDHDGQLATLREGLPADSRVVVADCLSACERSNVMVVSPTREARRAGARPVWLEQVLDPGAVTAVVDWVRAGGPGRSDVPAALASYVGVDGDPAELPA